MRDLSMFLPIAHLLEGGFPDIGHEAEFGYQDIGSHMQLDLFLRLRLRLRLRLAGEHVTRTETVEFIVERIE